MTPLELVLRFALEFVVGWSASAATDGRLCFESARSTSLEATAASFRDSDRSVLVLTLWPTGEARLASGHLSRVATVGDLQGCGRFRRIIEKASISYIIKVRWRGKKRSTGYEETYRP